MFLVSCQFLIHSKYSALANKGGHTTHTKLQPKWNNEATKHTRMILVGRPIMVSRYVYVRSSVTSPCNRPNATLTSEEPSGRITVVWTDSAKKSCRPLLQIHHHDNGCGLDILHSLQLLPTGQTTYSSYKIDFTVDTERTMQHNTPLQWQYMPCYVFCMKEHFRDARRDESDTLHVT